MTAKLYGIVKPVWLGSVLRRSQSRVSLSSLSAGPFPVECATHDFGKPPGAAFRFAPPGHMSPLTTVQPHLAPFLHVEIS